MRRLVAALLLAGAAMSAPALASGSKVSSPLQLAKQAEKLKPGEWVWAGRIAPTGPVLVYASASADTTGVQATVLDAETAAN